MSKQKIIIDISANTHLNSQERIDTIISRIAELDGGTKDVVIKGQLFDDEIPPNVRCTHNSHTHMDAICRVLGYKCTASVFDVQSLQFLLSFKDLPFVKIACRPELYHLAGFVPRNIDVYISRVTLSCRPAEGVVEMQCSPKYPAKGQDYLGTFADAVSDHSNGLDVFKMRSWSAYECHYVPDSIRSPSNPDAGTFAKTDDELKEILR